MSSMRSVFRCYPNLALDFPSPSSKKKSHGASRDHTDLHHANHMYLHHACPRLCRASASSIHLPVFTSSLHSFHPPSSSHAPFSLTIRVGARQRVLNMPKRTRQTLAAASTKRQKKQSTQPVSKSDGAIDQPRPRLDISAFPHIIDKILSYCTFGTCHRLLCVSREFRTLVERALPSHIIVNIEEDPRWAPKVHVPGQAKPFFSFDYDEYSSGPLIIAKHAEELDNLDLDSLSELDEEDDDEEGYYDDGDNGTGEEGDAAVDDAEWGQGSGKMDDEKKQKLLHQMKEDHRHDLMQVRCKVMKLLLHRLKVVDFRNFLSGWSIAEFDQSEMDFRRRYSPYPYRRLKVARLWSWPAGVQQAEERSLGSIAEETWDFTMPTLSVFFCPPPGRASIDLPRAEAPSNWHPTTVVADRYILNFDLDRSINYLPGGLRHLV